MLEFDFKHSLLEGTQVLGPNAYMHTHGTRKAQPRLSMEVHGAIKQETNPREVADSCCPHRPSSQPMALAGGWKSWFAESSSLNPIPSLSHRETETQKGRFLPESFLSSKG